MKTTFRRSFVRDLKKVKDQTVRHRVRRVIEAVEAATDLQGIGDFKKLAGTHNCYRIRIGEYRLGVVIVPVLPLESSELEPFKGHQT